MLMSVYQPEERKAKSNAQSQQWTSFQRHFLFVIWKKKKQSHDYSFVNSLNIEIPHQLVDLWHI